MSPLILLSIAISILIFILFVMSVNKKAKRSYGAEMVTLGILGTFVGVAIGIFGFDRGDIQGGLEGILGGLSMALITSIVGLFFSLLATLIRDDQRGNEHRTMGDLHAAQMLTVQTLERTLKDLGENSSKAMIETLASVVKDFNTKLNEQFGQNFAELNQAVRQMAQWQSEHKEQMAAMQKITQEIVAYGETLNRTRAQQEERLSTLMGEVLKSGERMNQALEESAAITRESLQLLLREANGSRHE